MKFAILALSLLAVPAISSYAPAARTVAADEMRSGQITQAERHRIAAESSPIAPARYSAGPYRRGKVAPLAATHLIAIAREKDSSMRSSLFAFKNKWARCMRLLATGFAVAALTLAGQDSSATVVTGSLATARYSHTSTTLPDGRVLIAGGHRTSGSLSSMTASAEIYDPVTGAFSATGSLTAARGGHAMATLADGRVLVVGGTGLIDFSAAPLGSAEIFDPATGVWSATGAMNVARAAPLALTLPDGRVLVIGGSSTLASSEIYDPATGTFTLTGSLATARGNPVAALLGNGRVLVTGGYPAAVGPNLASTEIWDPVTGLWSAGGPLASGRAYATATTLSNGQVLVAGGHDGSAAVAAAELYDPASNTFIPTGPLNLPRYRHVATVLADGNVMVSGSAGSTDAASSDEIYELASGTWRRAGWLSAARSFHTVSPLAGGNVLIAGGGSGPLASAEIFYPSCAAMTNPIMPTSQNFTASGGSATVSLLLPLSCGWSITRVPSWMTVTSGLSGMGSATVTYTVAPQTTSNGRSATVRIADSDFSLNQTGVCSPTATASLFPAGQNMAAVGGSGSIAVTHGTACAWSVAGVPAWMTISAGASGQGNGNVTYSVAANTGAARSATLSIGGTNFVLSQAAAAPVCDPAAVATISPGSASFSGTAGSGSFSVSHGAGCAWSVSGVPAWISITSGASGQGNGTVSYTVAANTNVNTARSATLGVAGKSFVVNQSAAAFGCTATRVSPGVSYGGTLASPDCVSGARGSNYYVDLYIFTGSPGQKISLQLSSTAFDTYLYLKEPSNAVVASNDDGGGGSNSRIPASSGYITLNASGTYVIEVTSYGVFSTGAYSLLFTQY